MKISGVYKITNTITGDFYIGSSKDVKQRWRSHKKPSTWKRCKNNPMYLDFQKFGVNNFVFEILAEAEEGSLKEAEQQFIEKLKPTYNNYYANGLDIERRKEACRKASRKYNSQLCYFNNEILTLCALQTRFKRMGIPHPQIEAKKYLLK